MTFAQDMAKFRTHLQRDAKRVHGAIGVKFLGDIIEATPIDVESTDLFGRPRPPGRLKRSWFTGIGMSLAFDGEQSDPFNQMAQVTFNSQPTDTVVMANGAPYAELIEYGLSDAPNTQPPPTWVKNYPAGINFQQPGGWVRVTADKFNQATVESLVHDTAG